MVYNTMVYLHWSQIYFHKLPQKAANSCKQIEKRRV